MDTADLSVPEGWMVEKDEQGIESFLSPDGTSLPSRRLGLKHMMEVGAPDECIEEMRSFLHLEGWSQHQELPNGWMLRVAENGFEGVASGKCSLMRDNGELFEDWTEGLKCLERLGKDSKKLKDIVAKIMLENRNLDHESSTSSREVLMQNKGTGNDDSDHFVDFKVKHEETVDNVKVILETEAGDVRTNQSPNNLKTSVDNVKNEERRKFEKITEDVSLPRGWRTRNTLGSKGFRIYSPPGKIFYSWHNAMADLKLRGGGSTEEVLALEHFLRVDGWSSHSLLPQGWKIRLKRLTAEVSRKVFLDADSHLVDKVNNENMKKLSLEERSKLQMLAKMPMKQLKLELERSADKLVELESDCEIQVIKSPKENLENGVQPKFFEVLPSKKAINETKMDQKATIIEKIRDEPNKQTTRIPTANNLPPELTSALEAGLISPTQLARLMAGELIDNPILGGGDKETSSMVILSDDKESNEQTAPKESVETDGSAMENPEGISNVGEEELETSTIRDEELETSTIRDEELATGWLDNDLLPSGWKLKIACDGKPSDEQGMLRKIFMAPSGLTMAGAQAVKYSRSKGFSRDDIHCMEQLEKKGAREVGLEIHADKKSKMSQEQSRLDKEGKSFATVKKASKAVEEKKWESDGDLRASVTEARKIAASINQDFKVTFAKEGPLKVSPQIIDGKAKVERVRWGEIQGGNLSKVGADFKPDSLGDGRNRKRRDREEEEEDEKRKVKKKRGSNQFGQVDQFGLKKGNNSRQLTDNQENMSLAEKKEHSFPIKQRDGSLLSSTHSWPQLTSEKSKHLESVSRQQGGVLTRRLQLDQTDIQARPFEFGPLPQQDMGSPASSALTSTSLAKPSDLSWELLAMPWHSQDMAQPRISTAFAPPKDLSPIKVANLQAPVIEIQNMGEIPVEILLPNISEEPARSTSKARGRPRGSYNLLTPEEKAERKTMTNYQWTKLQRARREAAERKTQGPELSQSPGETASTRIVNPTDIEQIIQKDREADVGGTKKDDVDDETRNIVWGLGFLKNLLDEENLKELMKTNNLGDVCQDLGRGMKTEKRKKYKTQKQMTSMGRGIDSAVNALLGFDTYNFADEIDAAVEAIANSNRNLTGNLKTPKQTLAVADGDKKPGFDLNSLIEASCSAVVDMEVALT